MRDEESGLEDKPSDEPADIIDRSLWYFERHLASLRLAGRSAEFLLARQMVETVVKVARAGRLRFGASETEGTVPSELLGVVAAVSAVSPAEKEDLINPLTLGLGAPTPKWMFLGYEAAYGLEEEPNFTLEACLLSVIWKAQLANGFHQHPYFLLRTIPEHARRLRQRGHYWNIVAQLTKATEGRWGDGAYLIEISARPARTHAGGSALSEDRIRFLLDVVRVSGAKVLVVANRDEHTAVKERLAAAFLREETLPRGESVKIRNGTLNVTTHFVAAGGRLVVFTRHLAGSIANEFLDQLHVQVERRIAPAPGPAIVRRRSRK